MKQHNLLTHRRGKRGTGCPSRGENHSFAKKGAIRMLAWVAAITGLLFLGSCKTCQCPAYSSVPPSAAGTTAQNWMETPDPTAWVQSFQGMWSN